jgi:hypothetical protein
MHVLTAFLLSLPLVLVPTSGGCGAEDAWTACEVANTGTEVNIGASTGQPGNGGGGAPSRGGGGGSSEADAPAEPAEPDCVVELGRCDINYSVVTFPDVTIEDLASFRPASPSLAGEPAGFGVVGMPTNVYASVSAQDIPGQLLGWDVTVRFEPAAFVFAYGDGTTSRSVSGGASWSALGQPQFTPTRTSHVYADRGVYPVSVTVQYTASVNFGTATWRPVPGYVSSTTGGYQVDVREVRTALVDATCLENPGGPGC